MSKKLTTEIFIERSNKIHNNKFDYCDSVFVDSLTPIKIICPIHGEFYQKACDHYKGNGCKKCGHDKLAAERIKTQEQFIEECKEIHGEKIDYSKAVYNGNKNKVLLTCNICHKDFEQLPSVQLRGGGCPHCSGCLKGTTEWFINKSIKVHGDLYEYDVTEYVDAKTPVNIRCKIHGVVTVNPTTFPNHGGCPECGRTKADLNTRYTQDEMLNKFKLTHGDKYNYDKFIYYTAKDKSIVTCEKHGDFLVTPASHIRGTGCAKCAKNSKDTTESFIAKAVLKHGNKFNYDNVHYINCHNKVEIHCNQCNKSFMQTPTGHLSGRFGCTECSNMFVGFKRGAFIEKYKNQDCTLYVVVGKDGCTDFLKIGITGMSTEKRLSIKVPYKFNILEEIINEAGFIWNLEKHLHKVFKQYKYEPNIKFGGSTECFTIGCLPHIEETIINYSNNYVYN